MYERINEWINKGSSVSPAGSHVIRSVLPADSRWPTASYNWLACGMWLKNAQTYTWQLITIGDQFSSLQNWKLS